MPRDPLPIDAVLPKIAEAWNTAGALVLKSPTGSGKTTRVAPALLHPTPQPPPRSGEGENKRILILEPRRVAARAAARRMAFEDGTPLGDRFGYHVRFDRKFHKQTRVVAATPGILLRMLHDDPFLETIDGILFDEFHERGLESDLAFGSVKLLRDTVRPDLRVVVMSATLDAEPIAAFLGGCPIIESEGRSYPVDVRYRPRRSDTPVVDAVCAAVRECLETQPGDVLAFLPGLREIRQCETALERCDALVLPLHGELPPEQQDEALRKHTRRKIVLATNVAETSVTVDGVTAVVDSGLARQMEYDTSVGLDRLRQVPISKASADQRAGRAGRTQPGICVRLWDEPGHRSRPDHTEPEIRRIDLGGAILHLLSQGETDVMRFPWFDPPRADAVAQSLDLLELLGATHGGALTELGKQMASLPLPPRLARMLIEGANLGVPERAALAAAMLVERDPFPRDGRDPHRASTSSDVLDRVEALELFERTGQVRSGLGELNRGAAKQLLNQRDQLLRNLESRRTASVGLRYDTDEALLRSLFTAFPDRLCKRRAPADRRAKMLGGRGVKLDPSSGVTNPALFVAIDIDAGGAESLVRWASAVEREWLPADEVKTVIDATFDETSGRIVARKQTRFRDLVLDETPAHIADETAAAQAMAAAARKHWDAAKPGEDSAAAAFLNRLACLNTWRPDLELPQFNDDALQALLPDVCRGLRSLDAVKHGPWLDLIKGSFSYAQLQTLDREAPERLEVPTGNQIVLAYEPGRPPILAVRVQEVFGWLETPRIAGGKVKVLLHLLAPNYRPQAITDDLESFWKNGYAIVRKELRMKYPKHSWPEDPFTAEAIAGPKRRK
jgi:ATP-dependent helicase HrpB